MSEHSIEISHQDLPVPVVHVGQDGVITDVNQAFLELVNFTLADVLGRPLAEFAADPSRFARLHDPSLHSGQVLSQKCTLLDQNRSEIPVSVSTLPEDDGYLVVFGDLRSARADLCKLHEAEERLRQITENAGQWIWELDARGVFTHTNPVVASILGYARSELVGRMSFYDLFAPAEGESVKNLLQSACGERRPFRSPLNAAVHKEGRIVWLAMSGLPITNESGELVGCRGVVTEIAEGSQAERGSVRMAAVLRAIRSAGQVVTCESEIPRLLQRVCDTLVQTRSYESAWAVVFEPRTADAGPEGTGPVLEATAEAGPGATLNGLLAGIREDQPAECVRRVMRPTDPGEPSAIPGQSRWQPLMIGRPFDECPGCPLRIAHRGQRHVTLRLAHDGDVYGVLGVSLPNVIPADVEESDLLSELAADLSYAIHAIRHTGQLPGVREALIVAESSFATEATGRRQAEHSLQTAKAELHEAREAGHELQETLRGVKQNLADELAARREIEAALLSREAELQEAHTARRAAEERLNNEIAAHRQSEAALRVSEAELRKTRETLQAEEERIMAEHTARRRTEDALRTGEAELRAVQEAQRQLTGALHLAREQAAEESAARDQAIQALREIEQKYDRIAEHVRDGIVILQDAAVKYASSGFLRMCDAPDADVSRIALADYVPLDVLLELLNESREPGADGKLPAPRATVLRRRNGAEVMVEISSSRVTHEGKPADLLFVSEIRAPAAGGETGKESAIPAGNRPLAVFVLDREGRFVFQHSTDESAALVMSDGVIGKSYSEGLSALAGELTAEALEKNGRGEAADYEYAVAAGKGSVWLATRLTPIFVNGEYAGSFAEVRDASDRKRQERQAELRRLDAELRRRVSELETAMKRLETFAESVEGADPAPMTTGKTIAESLPGKAAPTFTLVYRHDYLAGLPEDTREQLTRARADAQHMQHLIDDFLASARTDAAEADRAATPSETQK